MVNLQAELTYLQAHLATLELPTPPQPPQFPPPPPLSIADLPTSSAAPTTYDLSSLFDPTLHIPSWTLHQRRHEFPTTARPDGPSSTTGGGGGGLQGLPRELLNRHAPPTEINEPRRNQPSTLPSRSS